MPHTNAYSSTAPHREWLPHIGAPAPTESGKKKIPLSLPPVFEANANGTRALIPGP